jgi:methylthioribulose 1-phosphate dehydratase/enolase-phosphatase E1
LDCSLLHCFAGNGVAAKRAKLSHAQLPRAIVLDIEGTVAPISFVADVMFPYARDNVAAHLEAHYDTPEARADVEAIRKQVGNTAAAAGPQQMGGR